MTGNVTALGSGDISDSFSESLNKIIMYEEVDISQIQEALSAFFIDSQGSAKSAPQSRSAIYSWPDVYFSSSKTVRWTDGDTSAYRTLTSKISTLYIYSEEIHLTTYKNFYAEYGIVYMYKVAPGTLYMSADVKKTSSGYEAYYDCPVTGMETPRYLSSLDYSPAYVILGFYNNGATFDVVDFYSKYNPLIKGGWSIPTSNPTFSSLNFKI